MVLSSTLTPDRSPGFADSLLYMESQLRATVPNDDRIHVGHHAAADLVPYQFDPHGRPSPGPGSAS